MTLPTNAIYHIELNLTFTTVRDGVTSAPRQLPLQLKV